jgi:hypothetical protein
MIKLKQPSLALHSYNVPGYKYRMWQTWKMPPTATAKNVVYWIQWAIDHSPELYLHNVIINCHGSPGYLHIGQNTGIGHEDLGAFVELRQKQSVGTIWIVACQVAETEDQHGRLGKYFCSELARSAACQVVAADKLQYVDVSFYLRFCPDHSIDDYEGTIYRWDAAGREEVYNP